MAYIWKTQIFSFLFFLSTVCYTKALTPIVIVPGIGGSQIEARLNRSETPHYWCYKQYTDWFTIWLSIEELLPFVEACWTDNMKLRFNNVTKRMENEKGVYTRVPDFGNTTAIEWLDPSVHGPGVYFYPFIDALTRLMGYKRGATLKAAPYDFRHDPSSAGDYFKRLKRMIEDSYKTYNKRVMLISHSMGVPYTLYFLNQQSQAWKDKHIKAWTTISGVFGGSVKAVLAYISGDGFGIPSVLDKPLTLRTFQRTFSSLAFILPNKQFWKQDEVILRTAKKNYTVHNYDQLFKDIDYPLASTVLSMVPDAWSDTPPGVEMFCLHGNQVKTPQVLNYAAGYFPDYYPSIEYSDGDGTVNLRSLAGCKQWAGRQTAPVHYHTFSAGEHNAVLGDTRLIRTVVDALKD